MLRGEIREVELEKGEAGRVLQRLRLRVVLDSFLLNERLHALHRLRVIPCMPQYVTGERRVRERLLLAPAQVADLSLGKSAARQRPPAQMLAADRQPERLGCLRREPLQPRA